LSLEYIYAITFFNRYKALKNGFSACHDFAYSNPALYSSGLLGGVGRQLAVLGAGEALLIP